MSPEYKRLLQIINDFVSGKNRSIAFVNDIEDLLITSFEDDEDIFDMLSLPLASYRPGGGDQLYDEEDLQKVFFIFPEQAGKSLNYTILNLQAYALYIS